MSETSEFTSTDRTLDSLAMEPVSSGATCETFKFQQWGKWFLVKRLRLDKRFDPIARAALEKEFDLGIHLDHPGIVRYYSKGEDEEGPYLLEEYIEGETLSEYVKSNAPLTKDEIRRVFGELSDAVSYLHSLGIIHSDIKPENIIITRQGVHPKLVDLGFASQYSYTPLDGGTPSFSAPEQFEDGVAADVRADVYSLGKVLELMANRHFKRAVKIATDNDPKKRFNNPGDLLKAVQRKSFGRQIAFITLLLFIAGIGLVGATAWHKTVSTEKVVAYHDSVFSTRSPELPSTTELFKKAVREVSDSCFKMLYSSYSIITMDNQPIILEEYAKCVEGTMRIHGEMIENWSAKYPSLRQEFEEASTADLSRVIRRYQQDMIDFSNSIQKSSME